MPSMSNQKGYAAIINQTERVACGNTVRFSFTSNKNEVSLDSSSNVPEDPLLSHIESLVDLARLVMR